MAASSGISSNSSVLQNSASEVNPQQLIMEQRRTKRMISNRESARRSRMRKQKLLDDLAAQVSQLRKENRQIVSGLHATVQEYLSFEDQNAVLRAQASELRQRLQSLNEIVSLLCAGNSGFPAAEDEADCEVGGFAGNCRNYLCQPIVMPVASADALFQYWEEMRF